MLATDARDEDTHHLRELVVCYGPFVMHTEAEIRQAIHDYPNGPMREIAV